MNFDLRILVRRWRRRRISTAPDLARFLERNAWLVSQKTVIGYCTVKTHLPIHELLKEQPFAEAYDVSIWEAYAAALADLVVVAETYLRSEVPAHQAAGQGSAVVHSLGAAYESLLSSHPLPRHRPQGWGEEIARLRQRLEAASAAPPQTIREISGTAAARIVATLPIHQRLREPDAPAVEAGVQFLMVGLAHEFNAALDWTALAVDLAGGLRPHPGIKRVN